MNIKKGDIIKLNQEALKNVNLQYLFEEENINSNTELEVVKISEENAYPIIVDIAGLIGFTDSEVIKLR